VGSSEVALTVKRKLFHHGLRAAKEHDIVADAAPQAIGFGTPLFHKL
jgi:hypothetical protein